ERTGRTGMLSIRSPRSVVGCEDYERALIKPEPLQCRHDVTDRTVQFLDHVTIQPGGTPASIALRREYRHVRHHVREIEEERPVSIPLDEGGRALGKTPRELRLIRIRLDDFLTLIQRQRGQPGSDRM